MMRAARGNKNKILRPQGILPAGDGRGALALAAINKNMLVYPVAALPEMIPRPGIIPDVGDVKAVDERIPAQGPAITFLGSTIARCPSKPSFLRIMNETISP